MGVGKARNLPLRFIPIEHPVDAELVGAHTEFGTPEGILEGHGYFAAGGDGIKGVGDLFV